MMMVRAGMAGMTVGWMLMPGMVVMRVVVRV